MKTDGPDNMTMAPRVRDYLAENHIAYQVMPVAPPPTLAPADPLHGPSCDQLAKAVLLRDEDADDFLLAVVPASHRLALDMLAALLGHRIELASESDALQLFPDCEAGALPPIGQRYGIEVVLDQSLAGRERVCFPCGSFASLAMVSGADFSRMMGIARTGPISTND